MNPSGPEQPVRQLYREQRAQDARQVPAFANLTRRGADAQPHRPVWPRGLRLALAGVVLAALATVFVRSRSAVVQPTPATTVAALILEWQSPTDCLLETPGTALLSSVPHFATSIDSALLSVSDNAANSRKETP